MATSSIFHNVKITDPKEAEAFIAALEASEKEVMNRPETRRRTHAVVADAETIRKLAELRRNKRKANNGATNS